MPIAASEGTTGKSDFWEISPKHARASSLANTCPRQASNWHFLDRWNAGQPLVPGDSDSAVYPQQVGDIDARSTGCDRHLQTKSARHSPGLSALGCSPSVAGG